jgi:hypothetical protein
LISVFLFFIAPLLPGYVLALSEYKPKSPHEEAVKSVIVAWLSAWNKKDRNGVLVLFSEDA